MFLTELVFGSVRFYGGRKSGEPREKLLNKGRQPEPTTNSTPICHQRTEGTQFINSTQLSGVVIPDGFRGLAKILL